MESLDAPAGFMDDLLNFSSDIGEEEEEDDDESNKAETLTALPFSLLSSRAAKTSGIVEEEELEWISNKDAFPMVESFVDIMPNHHHPAVNNHQSPVSVLENSTSSFNSNASNGTSSGGSGATTTTTITTAAIVSLSSNLKVPVRARSKRRMRRRELFGGQPWQCWAKETQKISKPRGAKPSSTLGRKCQHCQTEKTPQWRAGPMGPKTLCNACGVRYKSGRLVPEYRPASSPTFSSEVHSNSHRKIVEMRRQKQGVAKPVVGPKPLEIGFIAFNLPMKDQIPVGKVIVHVSHVREASKLLFGDFTGKKRLKETGTESTDSCFSTSSDLILRLNMPCDLCDVRTQKCFRFLIQRPTT